MITFWRGTNLNMFSLQELQAIVGKYKPEVPAVQEKGHITDTPVVGYESQFFGRMEELRKLANSIIRGDHAIIIGAQRTGKSSLMEELKNEGGRLFKEISKKLENTLFIEIDFQGVGKAATRDEFEGRFKNGIIKSLTSQYVSCGGDLSGDFRNKIEHLKFDSSLPQFLHKYMLPFITQEYGFDRIVFFLDEFSELIETIHNNAKCSTQQSEMVDVELMRFISSLMKDRDLKGFYVYVLALRPFYTTYHDRYDLQILKNIGTPIGLDYFDFDTAEKLIKTPIAGKLDFSDESVRQIYALSAGHPWFTSFFCKQLETKLMPTFEKKKRVELGHVTDLTKEMTGNEKSFQYDFCFSVLEIDFSLEEDERKVGQQILAIISNIHVKNGQWPSFSAIFEDLSKHRNVGKELLSDIIANMVRAQILRENKHPQKALEYQIRMGILFEKYRNQNLYDRYFR